MGKKPSGFNGGIQRPRRSRSELAAAAIAVRRRDMDCHSGMAVNNRLLSRMWSGQAFTEHVVCSHCLFRRGTNLAFMLP